MQNIVKLTLILLVFMMPSISWASCTKKLYKTTVMQGFFVDEAKGFDNDPSQEVRILIKADCPGEMVVKTQVTQQLTSAKFNKGEKVFFDVKEIGLIDSGSIDYKPFNSRVLSVAGKRTNGTILDADESYKSAVKRSFNKAKNFALYPVNCYDVAKRFSNSPFSPLLLVMEPFYFVLGLPLAAISPVTAIFAGGEKIHIKKGSMAEIEVLEDIDL